MTHFCPSQFRPGDEVDMMSTAQINLDPEKTERLEPREGDERNVESISPFAVPQRIVLESVSPPNLCLRFLYPGGETGEEWEPLDSRSDPPVMVLTARFSKKILELRISGHFSTQGLFRIADRLEVRAFDFSFKAKKFSYLMISRVLREWEEWLANAMESAPAD